MKVMTPSGMFDIKAIRKIGFGSNANVKMFLSSARHSTLPPQVLFDYMHAECEMIKK